MPGRQVRTNAWRQDRWFFQKLLIVRRRKYCADAIEFSKCIEQSILENV